MFSKIILLMKLYYRFTEAILYANDLKFYCTRMIKN